MANLKYKHTAYTSAQWASLNPVIVENEIVIESDTKRTKIGNGISTYNQLEYADANSIGNSLGSIKPTDAAPTPARNGNYTFSIGGNKPAWLTAEAGVTTVKAGDGVAVVYTAPSSYTYTHVDMSIYIEQVRSQATNKVPASKLLDDELNKKVNDAYPWNRNIVKVASNPIYSGIIDLEIVGGDKNWRVVVYTFERNVSNLHRIRLAVYDENNQMISAIGNNGILAEFLKTGYTEPAAVNGKIIDILDFNIISVSTIYSVRAVVDWSLFPLQTNYGAPSYTSHGLNERCIRSASLQLTKYDAFKLQPASQEVVFARGNYFTLGNVSEVFLDVQIYGVTDKTKRYGIERLQFSPVGPARSYLAVREFLNDGTASTRVALWDNSLYTPPTAVNGKQIDTLTLVPQNSSGITIIATVDWAKLPLSGTQWTGVYWYSNAFKVTDGEFSYNAYKDGSVLSGSATVNFQIDGVNCRLITPDAYGQSDKTHLLIFCHGNGQNYTSTGSASFMAFCKANNIAIATTTGQDEVSAPFTTNASGWGNYVHLQRYVKLYNYLISRYNFHNSVIISGESMGGLIAGHLCYTKHIPIQFAVLAGPVPDLSYIFANGGSTRKSPIRNSYGMAADGSDDANLENFISGYDWFDMGLTEISGSKYKVGFPHIYINVGTGDSTFSVDFGGTAKYTEIVNAIRDAGGFISYNEIASVSHAANECFDKFITDGVFEKELGI